MKSLTLITAISAALSILAVSNLAQATIAPNAENMVGLTCDTNPKQTGHGKDFGLAFRWSPFKGMSETGNIEGNIEKSVKPITELQSGETTLFVKSKKSKTDLVEVLVFKTADMFNQHQFPAKFYKGSMRLYSPATLKETKCQAVNAFL